MARVLRAAAIVAGVASATPVAAAAGWYAAAATDRQRVLFGEIVTTAPLLASGGLSRLWVATWRGLVASLDYKYSLAVVDAEEDPDAYAQRLSDTHTRAAQHILDACLANGGNFSTLKNLALYKCLSAL